MLRIRKEQVHTLGRHRADRFEHDLANYLRSEFEDKLAGQSPEQVLSLVREEIQQAKNYGIETEVDIERFLEFRVSLGPQFDTRNDWIQEILVLQKRTGAQKLRMIEDGLVFQSRAIK